MSDRHCPGCHGFTPEGEADPNARPPRGGFNSPPDHSWVRTVDVRHDNDPPTWWDRLRRRR